jgi:hypothetical protein
VRDARWSDRRIVLWMTAVMAVLIVAISVLAPASEDDTRPSTYNTSPEGAKAAFLMLQAIGRTSSRWERPISDLTNADAAHSTLVLAAPAYAPTDRDAIAAAIKQFMERGGHVLTTGPTGALLLPDGRVGPPTMLMSGSCETDPGEGPLAAAGSVPMSDDGVWDGKNNAEVAERCGRDAVVVRMTVGHGEAVWWSSAHPLTNGALTTDADLRLLLLSVGDGRAVLWDESLHGAVPGLWSAAHGLPVRWLAIQVVLVAILLVLSFSRRNGPIRTPVMVPRTSPLEFAYSMGDLYEKARATRAATEAARRRLLRVIVRDAGVPKAAVASGPGTVVIALNARLGGDWTMVGAHLEQAQHENGETPTNREALAIARALGEDAEKIRGAARGRARPATSVRLA